MPTPEENYQATLPPWKQRIEYVGDDATGDRPSLPPTGPDADYVEREGFGVDDDDENDDLYTVDQEQPDY